ncbi:DMT family transporter [Aquitalea aquatica]|uniref:DMT family transporter n=1 Tax=Aquitalea aquatica TaxID=3044273 RepID=A0A838XZ51_9NEIS|nr:DMT family transporter [Aquitalea magnusonii]MBA4707666.1 DMT family transporter [Aquitalea magnusonii]
MNRALRPGLAEASLVLVTLIAGFGWLCSKEVLRGMPPLLFLGVRFASAGVVLAALARLRAQPLPWRLPATSWWSAAMLALAMVLWMLALQLSNNLGVGAFIGSLGVVLAPVLARLMFGTVLLAQTLWAMPLAVLGVAAMALHGGWQLDAADSLFLASAVAMSVFLNLNGRAGARAPALSLTALQLLLAGLAGFAGSVMVERWPASLSPAVWGWLLVSILLATCGRFFLQGWAQARVPMQRSAFILLLEPVWTAMLAWLWFGSSMSASQLAGAGLIMSSLLISRRKPRRRGSLQSPVPAGRTRQ